MTSKHFFTLALIGGGVSLGTLAEVGCGGGTGAGTATGGGTTTKTITHTTSTTVTGSGGTGGSTTGGHDPTTAVPITYGTPATSTFVDAMTSDFYSFNGTAGDRLVIAAIAPQLQATNMQSDPTITQPTIVVLGSDMKTTLTYQAGGFPGGQNATVYVQLPSTGAYYIGIQDCNGLFKSGCNPPGAITNLDYELIVSLTSKLVSPEVLATMQDGTTAKAMTAKYTGVSGKTGQYYDTLLGGDFQSATDTHVFSFTPPSNTTLPNTGARARAEFYVQAMGTDIQGGDLSDANIKIWATDSTGKVVSRADQNNYPTNATTYSLLEFSLPVTLGNQYYLYVQNTKTGGSPTTDFYFIDHYLPAPLYNVAEKEGPNHSGTNFNDTAATAEQITVLNKTLFTVDGNIDKPGTSTWPTSDIDWFWFTVPTGVTQYAYQCDSARSGSGVGGFQIALYDAASAVSTTGTPFVTSTETLTADLTGNMGNWANLPATVAAGMKMYMQLTGASQDASTPPNTGTQYRCYVFFQ